MAEIEKKPVKIVETILRDAHQFTKQNACCSTNCESNQTQNNDLDGIQI